ncbi:Heterokaryon incompatibility protein (HET) domain containing protein [Hyaloscypha variabilis]
MAVGTVQNVADAEENWELMKKWLYVCQNSHTKCEQNKPLDRQLPTRLIEVGDTDMDLRLCETLGLPQELQYLTLSHCWGGKVFTTLTRENFEQFLSHIPTESLSKTFRDAIEVTRRLGFKYLWIDSLCIIQGDEVDWTKEASRMEFVYLNSALNIAASAAPDGDFGCFSTRIPDQLYGCKVLARDTRDVFDTAVWDITIEDMTSLFHNEVLKTRAWAFQESLLAPKTISFTSRQLVWECISTRACETFPNSYDVGTVTYPSVRTEYWDNPRRSISMKWSSLLMDYTEKKVTFDKDRLVALSGLARLFAAKFGTTYVAGLWKEGLVTQLVWRVSDEPDTSVRNSMPSCCVDLEDEPMICGLVIEPVQPASYQRTGYFRTFGNSDVQQFLDAQKLNSHEDKNFIGEALDIVDEDGMKMCIITLI